MKTSHKRLAERCIRTPRDRLFGINDEFLTPLQPDKESPDEPDPQLIKRMGNLLVARSALQDQRLIRGMVRYRERLLPYDQKRGPLDKLTGKSKRARRKRFTEIVHTVLNEQVRLAELPFGEHPPDTSLLLSESQDRET